MTHTDKTLRLIFVLFSIAVQYNGLVIDTGFGPLHFFARQAYLTHVNKLLWFVADKMAIKGILKISYRFYWAN